MYYYGSGSNVLFIDNALHVYDKSIKYIPKMLIGYKTAEGIATNERQHSAFSLLVQRNAIFPHR